MDTKKGNESVQSVLERLRAKKRNSEPFKPQTQATPTPTPAPAVEQNVTPKASAESQPQEHKFPTDAELRTTAGGLENLKIANVGFRHNEILLPLTPTRFVMNWAGKYGEPLPGNLWAHAAEAISGGDESLFAHLTKRLFFGKPEDEIQFNPHRDILPKFRRARLEISGEGLNLKEETTDVYYILTGTSNNPKNRTRPVDEVITSLPTKFPKPSPSQTITTVPSPKTLSPPTMVLDDISQRLDEDLDAFIEPMPSGNELGVEFMDEGPAIIAESPAIPPITPFGLKSGIPTAELIGKFDLIAARAVSVSAF